jgi:hypothetical protein
MIKFHAPPLRRTGLEFKMRDKVIECEVRCEQVLLYR